MMQHAPDLECRLQHQFSNGRWMRFQASMSDIASAKSALGTESDAATLSEGSSHGVIGAAVGEMSSQRKSKTDSSFKDRQGAPQFSDWWIVNAARDPPRVL
mmetsp:Transcript_15298/g.31531  ORF Transcript_15298/g.31531 Transcript_15298/m.31531 type:complete len:101 (+) Transcript_15298:180-482(+)